MEVLEVVEVDLEADEVEEALALEVVRLSFECWRRQDRADDGVQVAAAFSNHMDLQLRF